MRAETPSAPPLSRTSPIKLATPPTPWSPAASRSSSTPVSKSSRCTRIICSASVLAPSYGREQRDLVALADRMVAPDIVLVHRDPDNREVAQCLGVTGAASAQPFEEPRDVAHSRRQRQLLLGLPDTRPQPGEIQQLHDAAPFSPLRPSGG